MTGEEQKRTSVGTAMRKTPMEEGCPLRRSNRVCDIRYLHLVSVASITWCLFQENTGKPTDSMELRKAG